MPCLVISETQDLAATPAVGSLSNESTSCTLSDVKTKLENNIDAGLICSPARKGRHSAVMCHICGREFGQSVLAIHLQQCEKSRMAQAAILYERDPVRVSLQTVKVDTTNQINSEGELSQIAESPLSVPTRAREKTQFFGGGGPIPKIERGGTLNSLTTTTESVASNQSRFVTCATCGREFAPGPYKIHKKHCNAEKLSKRSAVDVIAEPVTNSTSPDDIGGCVKIFVPEFKRDTSKEDASLHDSHSPKGDAKKMRSKSFYRPAIDSSSSVVITSVSSDKLTPCPKVVLCYICGREFGIGSVDVHMPQCKKMFEANEALKPPEKRRTLPTPPKGAPSSCPEEYNALAQESWFDELLVTCGYCGKSFPEESLATHHRSCAGKTGKILYTSTTRESFAPESLKSVSLKKKLRATAGGDYMGRLRNTAMVACHICGREFGVDTIARHSAECASRHEAQELARKTPKPLSVASGPPAMTVVATRNHATCKSSPSTDTLTSSPVASKSTVACQICGREFSSTSIDIHVKQCAKKLGGREDLHGSCNQWKDLGN